MGIIWSDESYKVKEESRWNRKKRDGGMNCNGFEQFPQMLYKAQFQPISGKYEVAMSRDIISADKTVVLLDAQQFNSSCQLTVRDEGEKQRAYAEGWRDSQAEAMVYVDQWLHGLSVEAAHRAHDDSNMTERAKAEAVRFEEKTADHVAEIPRTPVRRQASPEVTAKRRESLAKARAVRAAKKEAGISGPA